MQPIVSVSNVSFAYQNKQVLRNINLDIYEGETVCLLGPNGCGKTTLLNCIHNTLQIQEGKILICGRDVKTYSVTELARLMGYVFQEHTAPFPYTSLEVVRMGRTPHLGFFQSPSKQDTEFAYSIMEELGIAHLAAKRYTNISGGERQLVLIARTLCQEPKIILFDEPTSHLDYKNQALVLRILKKLSQRGITIIMTSHFPNHVWSLGDKVAMMGYDGFVAMGKVEEVMTEENLSKTYGVDVHIYEVVKNGKIERFCTPEIGL